MIQPTEQELDELTLRVAEICGWTKMRIWKNGIVGIFQSKSAIEKVVRVVPDYARDLDAMHDAEKVINKFPTKWERYVTLLSQRYFDRVHAPAWLKAKAFVEVMG